MDNAEMSAASEFDGFTFTVRTGCMAPHVGECSQNFAYYDDEAS